MSKLLVSNNRGALIGRWDGSVETLSKPDHTLPEDWRKYLSSKYGEPEHWFPDEEGAPFTRHTGGYWHDEKGQMVVEVIEGIEPYKTFADDTLDLSVSAAFIPHLHMWVIADRRRSP